MTLDRHEHFLLARFVGNVERNESAFRQADVGDDRPVRRIVEVKEGPRVQLELRRSRLTELMEIANLVQEIGNPLEASPATVS